LTTPASPPPAPQRRWQALCPGCGAPVEFASAASASAVCSFCRSTLVREGEALRRIGVVSELFDDHSPLQLGASGRHQGANFTLVGRLQYRYAAGTWNEWHALFDGEAGKSAWLSEDNGAYVMAFDQPPLQPPPAWDALQVGQRVLISGEAWRVASRIQASLIAAEGELPRPPRLDGSFPVADLRMENGSVGTLDGQVSGQPQWSIGQRVGLADLQLRGLKEGASQASLQGRTLACPSCGANVLLNLAHTQTVTCGQCKSVIDVSAGVGGDLAHYQQANSGASGRGPGIPLGASGRLAVDGKNPIDWQVVGFQERCSLPEGEDDHSEFWREYLLYNRQEGFAFLSDTYSGWSVVRPITGVPEMRLAEVVWQGRTYWRTEEPYRATTTWVLGEFYWQVRQGESLEVTDYRERDGEGVLASEQSDTELVWSAGRRVPNAEVNAAFGLAVTAPTSASTASRRTTEEPGLLSRISHGLIVLLVVIAVMLLLARCDGSDSACDAQRQTFGESSAEYQQCLRNQRSSGGYSSGGGSFGGFSSGGSHK
jgi:ribosomal protein S27AE